MGSFGATWQHTSWRGRAKGATTGLSHMAAREPASLGVGAKTTTMGAKPHVSSGARLSGR
jgi:hypothetical protein